MTSDWGREENPPASMPCPPRRSGFQRLPVALGQPGRDFFAASPSADGRRGSRSSRGERLGLRRMVVRSAGRDEVPPTILPPPVAPCERLSAPPLPWGASDADVAAWAVLWALG